jgi:hypothetical protein
MTVVTLHRLAEAPLSLDAACDDRSGKVAAMARILLDKGCYADHGDSIMVLVAAGHATFEIFALIEDVKQVAAQHAVEMEICKP